MRPVLLLRLILGLTCGDEPLRPGLADDLARIDAVVRAAHETGATAGLGVGIAVDGRAAYTAALGKADASADISAGPDTYWYLASTSKSLTGFGIALLTERGLVNPDAPISDYLPEAEWPEGVNPRELTVADFLGHTHGLGNGPVVLSAAFTGAFPESEHGRLLRFSEPGSRELRYSNTGYNVAALVISSQQPEGWKAFLAEEVYAPAGMSETFAQVSGLDSRRIAVPHDIRSSGSIFSLPFVKTDLTMNAAGGHLATIADLTRWTIVQMDGGRIDGEQVFPEDAVRSAHRILREQDREFAFFQRDGWGMGWDVGSFRGEHMVSRFGSYNTTRSHLSFLPEHRVGVVAMTNGPSGSILTDIIAAYAYDVFLGHDDADSLAFARLDEVRAQTADIPRRVAEFEEVQRSRARPYPRPLADYAGTYTDEAFGAITFAEVGDTLAISWGVLSGPTTVFNAEDHQLRHELLGGGSVVTFVFDGPGHAVAIETFGRRVPYDPRGTGR